MQRVLLSAGALVAAGATFASLALWAHLGLALGLAIAVLTAGVWLWRARSRQSVFEQNTAQPVHLQSQRPDNSERTLR